MSCQNQRYCSELFKHVLWSWTDKLPKNLLFCVYVVGELHQSKGPHMTQMFPRQHEGTSFWTCHFFPWDFDLIYFYLNCTIFYPFSLCAYSDHSDHCNVWTEQALLYIYVVLPIDQFMCVCLCLCVFAVMLYFCMMFAL